MYSYMSLKFKTYPTQMMWTVTIKLSWSNYFIWHTSSLSLSESLSKTKTSTASDLKTYILEMAAGLLCQ